MGFYKERFIDVSVLLALVGLIIVFMAGVVLLSLGLYKFLLLLALP